MTLFSELLALVIFTVLIVSLVVGLLCVDAMVNQHIDILFK